jgi:hypothetical protein
MAWTRFDAWIGLDAFDRARQKAATAYLVAVDYGKFGVLGLKPTVTPPIEKRSFRICSPDNKSPIRLIAFNASNRWSDDVSAEIARERCDLQRRDIPFFLQDFCDGYEGRFQETFACPSALRRPSGVCSRSGTDEIKLPKCLPRARALLTRARELEMNQGEPEASL